MEFAAYGCSYLDYSSVCFIGWKSVNGDTEIGLAETARSVVAVPYVSGIKNYWLFEKEIGETEIDFKPGIAGVEIMEADSINRLPDDSAYKVMFEFAFEDGRVPKEM